MNSYNWTIAPSLEGGKKTVFFGEKMESNRSFISGKWMYFNMHDAFDEMLKNNIIESICDC